MKSDLRSDMKSDLRSCLASDPASGAPLDFFDVPSAGVPLNSFDCGIFRPVVDNSVVLNQKIARQVSKKLSRHWRAPGVLMSRHRRLLFQPF